MELSSRLDIEEAVSLAIRCLLSPQDWTFVPTPALKHGIADGREIQVMKRSFLLVGFSVLLGCATPANLQPFRLAAPRGWGKELSAEPAPSRYPEACRGIPGVQPLP